jgi:LysR family nitrogen assimilation transcriptional regulator
LIDALTVGEARMNIRRLRYFLKIIDVGSLTRAAEALHIAQPALSQQLIILEGEFKQPLVVRSKQGVTPTAAGLVLYRHAQTILRQLDQACSDVNSAGLNLSGSVSIGLAPGTAASALALPLLKAVRASYPDIVLYINENFGTTLSELIMNGRMDMAVLYGFKSLHGLDFLPLVDEQLYLVSPDDNRGSNKDLSPADMPLSDIYDLDLLLPRSYNVVRKLVDAAFMRAQRTPRVVAEIESLATLSSAVLAGIGSTILPGSTAYALAASGHVRMHRIVHPVIEAPLALCLSSNLPLSAPAQAVKMIVLELVGKWSERPAALPIEANSCS